MVISSFLCKNQLYSLNKGSLCLSVASFLAWKRNSFLGHSIILIPCLFCVLNVLLFLQTHYVLLLCSFKEQLQQHVRVHAMEAVMACWELEQTLQSLTGTTELL